MNDRCTCPEPTQLAQLLDASLATVELEAVTQHVGECPECQRRLDDLAADATLKSCVCAAKEKPAPDSAFWPALRSLQQIAEPMPTHPTTPLPDPRTTAFLSPPDQPDHIGRLGRFRILGVLGQGGMGMVLLAHDPRLQRQVAIKVLDPQLATDHTARERFCREARTAALVGDDNIVAVHEVSPEDGTELPYLVMQLIDGETLEARLLRLKKLPLNEIVRIGLQIASGLAAAHDKGLIHRDVKPGNVLLEKGTDRVKLTDFGLARATEDLRLTRSGMVAGTPLYMAPEQARGEELDQRADLFSLGVVLYEMATGTPPFTGKTPLAVLQRLADKPHQPVRELNPEVPEWLAEVIDKLLAKLPTQRFQTAREVASLLEQHYLLLRTSAADHVVCPRAKVRRKILQLSLVAGLAGVALTLATLGIWKGIRSFSATTTPPVEEPTGPTPWATLRSDQGPVHRVAVSVDGTLVAVATERLGVRIWNPKEGKVEAVIPLTGAVWSVAFSPDGKLLATAGEDGFLRLWEWPGRDLLHEMNLKGPLRSVAFSADSKLVVAATRPGTVAVYETDTGLRGLEQPAPAPVYAVAFSPDGRNFATASGDGKVAIWDTRTGTPRIKVSVTNALHALAFSPDGMTLATGGWDGIIRLWDTGTGELRSELDPPATPEGTRPEIRSLSFCPSGRVIATGCSDGTIHLWNVAKAEQRLVLKGHGGFVNTVAIAPGSNLATGSRDGLVLMWKIPPICIE